MIVTSAAGYVAGTYLSTAAISGILAAASTALGAGALYLSGAAGSIIGSAGIFGTTVGASGITGALMSAGIISSTPIQPITHIFHPLYQDRQNAPPPGAPRHSA